MSATFRTNPLEQYRLKLARIAMDEMYQFVAVLDAKGILLEVNRAALEGAGLKLSDVEGKPFWECYWWTVSRETQDDLKKAISRAARGEFVRYDVEVYGRASGKETIIIDFSMIPVRDDSGQVTHIVPEGRDITEKKAYEREIARKNIELAALDRAKTAFFSNVSHEFRTPLTLMLGPVEDGLADVEAPLPPAQRERLELARRNALRLQKLVNTLLDFSRIEAGRAEARYAPTDLSALTASLASSFRSAIEKAGLKLVVECPPLGEAAYVDHDMWEKIVLNLLSNAFKFTLDGEIAVVLRRDGATFELSVRDTGSGIRADELPRVFERFHRVAGAKSRTHEGTGIGLALVRELARLHGGTVRVDSVEGTGSTFTVSIPAGKAHLPADHIGGERTLASTSLGAEAFTEEALRWLPSAADAGPKRAVSGQRILIADDNADLREYLRSLLGSLYQVEAVADGAAALAAARLRRPDLVLTDVMMPGLDGFGLIRELRSDPDLQAVPVIVLSARAGEESRLEGLEKGADDYVLKPFSAGELVGRVAAFLRSAEARRAALEQERLAAEQVRRNEQELSDFFDNATVAMHWVGLDGTILRANKAELDLLGYRRDEYVGRHIAEFHVDQAVIHDILARLQRGEAVRECEARLRCRDGSVRDVLINSSALFENGRFIHSRCFTNDVTERKRAEEALRRSEARLEAELGKTRLLQGVSTELLHEKDTQALYGKIVDAAMEIMRSDFASMQEFYPDRGKGGELHLLAFRGFNPQAAKFWEWVRADSDCTCGIALRRGTRVIEPDVAMSEIMAGTADQATYAQTGIGAVQSTPLVSRSGKLLGMLSTHWRQPHEPAERDLRLLDILARQAADLIERRKGEQVLGKLAAIVETSDDAIVSKNLDGIITTWNRGAERLFGYTAQEAIGRPVTMLMPPDRVNEEPGILKRIREGLRIEHYETVRRRKDGPPVDVSLSVSPILDEHGTVVGASKIARDITERKRAEKALRDADRRKEEFLAMLSHELRNPLAPMRHAVTLLQQVDEGEIRRQACAILDRQVEHMTRLVEELLDISRISRGSIEVLKEEVDLAAIVETAVETSRPLVEAAGHRLEVTLPRTPVSIVADGHRLAQVVSNLLNNAVKYTPRGGRIGLNISTAHNAAAISIRDNGIGIAPDDLPRLFNMFTQLNGARRYAPDGGMGVGLALARRLVELHGGTIEARSEGLGRGSEFTVRLPLAAADSRSGASARPERRL